MTMLCFVARRLAAMVLVMFAISVLTFLIFVAIPNGNPAIRLAGRTATPQDIAAVRHAYGFDRPIWVQYWRTMHQIFNGSILSYGQHVTVFSQIKRGLPATLSLAIGAAIIWLVIGVALGVIGAMRTGKASDVAITTFGFIGLSAPTFVVGAVMIYLFSVKVRWLPQGGYVPLTSSPVHWFTHLLMPWFALAIGYVGIYAQVLRSSVLDAMTTDAVRTARAKGLSRQAVLVKHVLRVSLIPIVSLWGLDFAAVLGGSTLIVETVFNLNGVGQYVAQSVQSLDVPPVLVVTMLGACAVVVMNAVVDVVSAILDPRIGVVSS
jgi:peptide/nickel transport system permease protein